MQAEKEKASKKKELKQAEARMNERVKKAFKKSSRCENMDNGYEYYNDFRDYFHPDEDHIIIGYNYKILPSGAGHDALEIGQKIPVSIIFTPSKDGRSHCPVEFTKYSDFAKASVIMTGLAKKLLAE